MLRLAFCTLVALAGCSGDLGAQDSTHEADASLAADSAEPVEAADNDTPRGPGDNETVMEPPRTEPDPDPVRTQPPESGIHPQVLALCRVFSDGGYDEACDVDLEHVHLGADEPRPAKGYLFPGVTTFNMNGWEWWQRWPGGHDGALFEAELATDAGMRCSVASAMRFAAILKSSPPALWDLMESTTWEGRFFNWNDDYSNPNSIGDGEGAALWAWEAHLIKWMSTTNRDGSCYLPTREMLDATIKNCQWVGDLNDGVIKNCQSP